MKKIIVSILLMIMCCFMLTACTETEKQKLIDPVVNDTSRFQYIGQDSITQNGNGETGDIIQYYLDNKTQIIYIVIVNRAGNGTWAGLTPLIDSDGTYVTYDEFIAED